MSATDNTTKTISFRVPARLERELQAVAHREGNPLSATVRRIVSAGLRSERPAMERRSNDGNEAA
jgi:predicted DNA-binding protein